MSFVVACACPLAANGHVCQKAIGDGLGLEEMVQLVAYSAGVIGKERTPG